MRGVFLLDLVPSTLFFLMADVMDEHMDEMLILFLAEDEVDFLGLLVSWEVEICLRVVLCWFIFLIILTNILIFDLILYLIYINCYQPTPWS